MLTLIIDKNNAYQANSNRKHSDLEDRKFQSIHLKFIGGSESSDFSIVSSFW